VQLNVVQVFIQFNLLILVCVEVFKELHNSCIIPEVTEILGYLLVKGFSKNIYIYIKNIFKAVQ